MVCDVMDKVNLVLDCINNTKHSVRTIVLMESPNTSLIERGQQAGIHILSLQEMMVRRLFLFLNLLLLLLFIVMSLSFVCVYFILLLLPLINFILFLQQLLLCFLFLCSAVKVLNSFLIFYFLYISHTFKSFGSLNKLEY